MEQAARYVQSLLPDKLKKGVSELTGGLFRPPSWEVIRSATSGSTTTTSPFSCSMSAGMASVRPCYRSLP